MLQIGIREPGSAITHFIAMMMAIFATSPLLVKAALNGNHTTILAMAVFMGSMVLLYGASTVYHSLVVRDKILKIFRKLDHMMIFVLIAGSYTPVCLIVLGGKSGYTLLAAVWGIAAAGCGLQSVLFFLSTLLRQCLSSVAPSLATPAAWLAIILSCGLEILLAALSVILVRRLFKNAMSIASMPELMNPSMPDSRP